MWIKTKDGRLHDAQQCSLEIVPVKGSEFSQVQLVPRTGKPISLTDDVPTQSAESALSQIENALGEGRLLIQL